MNQLQKQYNYNANDYYQGKYDAVYGEGAWDGGTGTGKPTYNEYSQNLVNQYNQQNGILTGTADGNLNLHQPCTRQQLIVFLWRFAKLLGKA